MKKTFIHHTVVGATVFLSSSILLGTAITYGEEATTPGKYKVTYKVNGQETTAIVEVKANQTEIKLRDTEVPLNGHWTPQDNVVSLKDQDGLPLSFEQVITKNNVNTKEVGLYFVKFTYKSEVAIAKVVVTNLQRSRPTPSATESDQKKQGIYDNQQNDLEVKTRIMLNDELLDTAVAIKPPSVKYAGGAGSASSNFGAILGSISGTLLYGSRRV